MLVPTSTTLSQLTDQARRSIVGSSLETLSRRLAVGEGDEQFIRGTRGLASAPNH